MADLYGAKGAIGGVFKGTTVALTLNNGGVSATGTGGTEPTNSSLKGAMAQNVNITYSRNVTRVWELGSDDTYYIIGHTEGQMSMARIVALKKADILDNLGDACLATKASLNLTAQANGCEVTDQLNIVVHGPILTSRGFSMDVGQFVMSSTAAMMFAGLEKS